MELKEAADMLVKEREISRDNEPDFGEVVHHPISEEVFIQTVGQVGLWGMVGGG